MYFQELQRRLIEIVRERVRAGELTERGLARMCGLSQPHMHNVLKEIRGLSPESADAIMRTLNLRITDLLWRISGESDAGVRAVPVARNRIGPGSGTAITAFAGHVPIPKWLLEGLVDPLVARIGPDLVLPKALRTHDLVLLDQNPDLRAVPGGRSLWIVAGDAGTRVRYLRMGGTRLYVADESSVGDPQKWQSISLHGRNILEIVRARIVWMGREMEKEPSGPVDPAGEDN